MKAGSALRPLRAGKLTSSVLRAVALFSIAVLTACTGDPGPVAGTVTTTGNTLTGRVFLSKGEPAQATVTLYHREYQPGFPDSAGSAANRTRFETRTDPSGRFKVTVTAGITYVLVAACGPQVQWMEGIHAEADPDSMDLGTIHLKPAAALKGRVLSAPGSEDTVLWAGYLGTGAFARADRQGAFSLGRLPTGSHVLAFLRDRRTPQGWARETFFTGELTLQAGRQHVLDSILLPEAPGPETLPAAACLERPASLIPWTAAAGEGRAGDRIRTIRSGNAADLIEMDLCSGTWRTVTRLPQQPWSLFSDSTSDFALFPSASEFLKIDGRTRTHRRLPYGFAAGNMDFHSGRFYKLTAPDSTLRVFSSEADFLADRPSRTWKWPYPLSGTVGDVAIDGSGVHCLAQTDSLRVYHFDLRDPDAPKTAAPLVLHGFAGAPRGFVLGKDDGLWILNGANTLFEYRRGSTVPARTLSIDHPDAMRGLTRFR